MLLFSIFIHVSYTYTVHITNINMIGKECNYTTKLFHCSNSTEPCAMSDWQQLFTVKHPSVCNAMIKAQLSQCLCLT